MNPEQKNRILIGFLAAALAGAAGLVAFQRKQGPTAKAPAPGPSLGIASSNEPKGQAELRIQGETLVTANTTGHEAKVLDDRGYQYEWTIVGGTLDEGSRGNLVKWTAGSQDRVMLTCTGTDSSSKPHAATLAIIVRPLAEIAEFGASRSVLTVGANTNLFWTIKNAKSATLDPGGIDVTKVAGNGYEVKPAETTTYMLKATNEAGTLTTKELTIKVVQPPSIGKMSTEAIAGNATAVRVVMEFTGGKAVLKQGDAVLTTSDSSPLSFNLENFQGASLTLVVTNEAQATATCPFTIGAPTPKQP